MLFLFTFASLSAGFLFTSFTEAQVNSTTIIPYLDTGYKFKVVSFGEGEGFEQPSFDDSDFSTGDAGFGSPAGDCLLNNPDDVKTDWPLNTDILLRKEFIISSGATNLTMGVAIDNDVQVFINGHDISGGLQIHGGCPDRESFIFTAPNEVLIAGINLLAVRGRDRGGLCYIDVQVNVDIVENCTNGIDDDGDGLVDCDDPECCGNAACFTNPKCNILSETLLSRQAVMSNVEVSAPDFGGTSTLNFTGLEFVKIATGSFAEKGFSKGACEATLEGAVYTGEWKGVSYLKSNEKRIYLKGAVTGQINATVEGYLTESVPNSGNYDKYEATWKIGRLGGADASATINVNGTISYQDTEYPGTKLYLLQANIETTPSGDYDPDPLNVVLTHLRVVKEDNPYVGEGFSIISYNSKSGAGQGWTYDRLLFQGEVEMKGLFSSPLYGVATATLNDSTIPRTLSLNIKRIDLGKPPAPDLKVKVWGPTRVSPGQTVDYMVEYRNDGLKASEEGIVVMKLPNTVNYVSNVGEGVYYPVSHEVVWELGNILPKYDAHISNKTTVMWGLPFGSIVEPIVVIARKDFIIPPTDDVSITYDILETTQNTIKLIGNVSSESGIQQDFYVAFSFTVINEKKESTFSINVTPDGIETNLGFSVETGLQPQVVKNAKFNDIRQVEGEHVQVDITTTAANAVLDAFETARNLQDANRARQRENAFIDWLYESHYLSKVSHDKLIPEGRWRHPNIYTESFERITGWVAAWLTPRFLRPVEPIIDNMANVASRTATDFLRFPFKFGTGLNLLVEVYASTQFACADGKLPPEVCNAGSHQDRLDALYRWWYRSEYTKGKSDAADSWRSGVTPARDPNIKYGPGGAVVAGQKLDYRIEFENEGKGIAYGVYFTDTLDEDLDASTLVIGPVIQIIDGVVGPEIGPPGTYNPATRTITWFVSGEGEIGPNVGGYAEISVNVKSGAANGTEIINYGTVYFPSVPEETRTNAIVSRIPLIEDCSDGIDNDEDGLTDCEDPDCFGQDCTEVCDDEMDNDGDGLVDCADTECPPCPEICDDGLDNDRDTLVDCDDPDCDCCDSTNYGKGTSTITFKGGKKDSASLQMCVNRAFCDALGQNPKALILRLDDCNEITIPGNKLRSDRSKTKFSASSSTYTLVIDCKKGVLSLRLKNVALKDCVSNPVKMCVSIKDGPCLCAEREFVEKRDKKGNLIGLSLRVTGSCPP